LAIAISTEPTMEAAAVAAALVVQEGEDNLPLDAFAAASAIATATKAAADSAAATVVRIQNDIVSTQTDIANLGTARRPRSTSSSRGS
jgi:hypothetical protein